MATKLPPSVLTYMTTYVDECDHSKCALVYKQKTPYSEHSITIFLTDIESLHRCFPRLEYINMDFILQPIPKEEVETTRAVKPAYTTTKIVISSDYIDTLWILYFANKYPNLIKHVTIHFEDMSLEENGIGNWIKYFSESVNFLDIKCYSGLLTKAKLFVPCHNLTLLNIYRGSAVDMDNILDQYPILLSLYICGSKICSLKYPQPSQSQHSLETLEIKDI
ncbi:hypothetical protein F4703DRAFT_1799958 [Phycomyces blakesleeanus]